VQNRFLLPVITAVSAAVVGGCSSSPPSSQQPPGSLPPNTAHVTVNGVDAGNMTNLECRQTVKLYSIKTGNADAGLSATIEFGDKITAQSVEIRNLAGFSGSYWAGTVGKGEATMLGNTYKITGTAVGSTTEKPNAEISVPYEIKANC
jgi:ipoprotein LpqH